MAAVLAIGLLLGPAAAFPQTADAAGSNCGGLEEIDVYTPEPDDVIQDPVLNWTIRSSLNSIKDHSKLTKEIVGSDRNVYIVYESGAHPENFTDWKMPYLIHDLEGIQYAKNATMVDIAYSADKDTNGLTGIKSLKPLASLTGLTYLKLYRDAIDDISDLAPLTNLEDLNLDFNYEIKDLSAVRNMSRLKTLSVQYSKLESIDAIEDLSSLRLINFSNNRISSLPELSKLTSLEDVNLSGNDLSDADVEKLARVSSITRLDLSGNSRITDIRPLARLINLEEEQTILPSGFNKEDFWAAKEVYSLFYAFNISKMTEDDLELVDIALEAYDRLSDEQKTYFDSAMIKAAKSNKALVEEGEEPVYYEAYDYGGGSRPVFSRIDVSVVDKYGKPLKGASVEKYNEGSLAKSEVTGDNGKVSIKHLSNDQIFEHEIRVKLDGYVSKPDKVTYEVKSGKTYIINGRKATGYEKIVFVMVKEDEITDKSELEKAISDCSAPGEEHTYTAQSYSSYKESLENARSILDNPDAVQSEIDKAASDLRSAYGALEKAEILTTLKIIVSDKNGNSFARPFRLQVYTPGASSDAWNIWADGDKLGKPVSYDRFSGAAYLKAAPNWKKDHVYEIACCNYEAYYFKTNIRIKVGVLSDGTRYISQVNGKNVGSDFTISVTAIPRPGGAVSKENEISPESSGFVTYYKAKADELQEAVYTPESYEAMKAAEQKAVSLSESSSATQEEMNEGAAAYVKTIGSLKERANNVNLEKLIALEFSKEYYTTDSWNEYIRVLESSQLVYSDANASQEEVDEAAARLKTAQSGLVLRGNKSKLKSEISRLEAFKAEEYLLGYEDLKSALAAAGRVDDYTDATQSEVDAAVELLAKAESELVRVPSEPNWFCGPNSFVARITDSDGNPLSGITFKAVSRSGKVVAQKIVSDSNGRIEFNTFDAPVGDEVLVTFAGAPEGVNASCDEVHSFVIKQGSFSWDIGIGTVDGKPYAWGENFVVFAVDVEGKSVKDKSISISSPETVSFVPGSEAKAALVVKDGDRTLEEGTDYVVEYKDCDKEGIASATVRGIGSYRDSVNVPYKVMPITMKTGEVQDFRGEAVKPAVELTDSYHRSLVEGEDYELSYSNNSKPGSASLKVTLKGRYQGSFDENFTIVCNHRYTKYTVKAGLLKDGYTASKCCYCSKIINRKTLAGYSANYLKNFRVSAGRKSFTAKWTKQSKANQAKYTGFQIRYSTSSKMTKAKTISVGKSSASKTIKKLTAKKRYYIQGRTYTKKNGKTYFSSWSAKKSVVTKK